MKVPYTSFYESVKKDCLENKPEVILRHPHLGVDPRLHVECSERRQPCQQVYWPETKFQYKTVS